MRYYNHKQALLIFFIKMAATIVYANYNIINKVDPNCVMQMTLDFESSSPFIFVPTLWSSSLNENCIMTSQYSLSKIILEDEMKDDEHNMSWVDWEWERAHEHLAQ